MLVERKEVKNEDDSIGYIESIFKSDNILKTTYFPAMQRLYIAFSRGHTYSYGNISPDFYEEFEEAESHGKFFHQYINNKTKYPYRKEFTLYPTEINEVRQIIEENKAEDNE
jgi:hypothetical protein